MTVGRRQWRGKTRERYPIPLLSDGIAAGLHALSTSAAAMAAEHRLLVLLLLLLLLLWLPRTFRRARQHHRAQRPPPPAVPLLPPPPPLLPPPRLSLRRAALPRLFSNEQPSPPSSLVSNPSSSLPPVVAVATSSPSSRRSSSRTDIKARGLEEPAIQALPAFRYRKAMKNDTVDSSECMVCLGEFQKEERVRLLPGCLHLFHVDCIDTWLQGNANCPLCRSAITTTTSSQLPLVDQLPRPKEVIIQVQIAGTEEEGTRTRQQEASTAATGSEGDAADQHVSSKGDECIAERIGRDDPPVRRSFSMDSLGRGEVHLQVQKISQKNTHLHGDGSDSCSSSITL